MRGVICSIIIGSLALSCSTRTYAQEVYKTTGPDGVVIFTDEPPTPDAEPLELQPLNVMDSREAAELIYSEPASEAAREAAKAVLTTISIQAPAAEETLRGTNGVVTVSFSVSPRLEDKQTIVLLLDGKIVRTVHRLHTEISGVERGTHTLTASLLDSEGNQIAQAGDVVFHLKQHSVLFK